MNSTASATTAPEPTGVPPRPSSAAPTGSVSRPGTTALEGRTVGMGTAPERCGDPAKVTAPSPITTRWVPSQRCGAPPVRRHPAAGSPLRVVGSAPTEASARSERGASADGDGGAPSGVVVPLEDEAARRVIAQTRAIGQAVLEVLGGSRAPGQLVRWMDPQVHEALLLRAELVRRVRESVPPPGGRRGAHRAGGAAGTAAVVRPLFRQATVRSVHACRIHARCWEMSLVVAEAGRCRAMAMRLEQRHLQWRVTALHLG